MSDKEFRKITAAVKWWAMANQLSDSPKLIIEVPTLDDEVRIRRALQNEFKLSAVLPIDLDKQFQLIGVSVEFKWPR